MNRRQACWIRVLIVGWSSTAGARGWSAWNSPSIHSYMRHLFNAPASILALYASVFRTLFSYRDSMFLKKIRTTVTKVVVSNRMHSRVFLSFFLEWRMPNFRSLMIQETVPVPDRCLLAYWHTQSTHVHVFAETWDYVKDSLLSAYTPFICVRRGQKRLYFRPRRRKDEAFAKENVQYRRVYGQGRWPTWIWQTRSNTVVEHRLIRRER